MICKLRTWYHAAALTVSFVISSAECGSTSVSTVKLLKGMLSGTLTQICIACVFSERFRQFRVLSSQGPTTRISFYIACARHSFLLFTIAGPSQWTFSLFFHALHNHDFVTLLKFSLWSMAVVIRLGSTLSMPYVAPNYILNELFSIQKAAHNVFFYLWVRLISFPNFFNNFQWHTYTPFRKLFLRS